jgi:signal peptidase I
VPIDNVVGRAFLITWPLSRFGMLDFHPGVFAGVPDAGSSHPDQGDGDPGQGTDKSGQGTDESGSTEPSDAVIPAGEAPGS